jgi:lipopolysaccharide transport system ATP-binding protein
MSASDIAVSIRNLSKSYIIAHGEEKHATLVETAFSRIRNSLKKQNKETFWALKAISFDIKKGDVVGIIGRNGAGKSTLLKVLSRITEPTTGQIELFGKVGSLLEVGTGFHPELTGRENVYLNGAILGMAKSDIKKQFDAIVDFAGVEKFLDTPVKRYSSGMYVRLAFAVAAHLSPDILIIDEVLAVGDAEFQKKCLGKMGEAARGGRTILFVSHNMAAISALCTTAVLLRSGSVFASGAVGDVINAHLAVAGGKGGEMIDNAPAAPDAVLKLRAVRVVGMDGQPRAEIDSTERAFIEVDYEVFVPGRGYNIAVQVGHLQHGVVFTSGFMDVDAPEKKTQHWPRGKFRFRFELPMPMLRGGDYTLEVGSAIPTVQMLDRFPFEVTFHILDTNSPVAHSGEGRNGAVLPIIPWERVELDTPVETAV